MGCPWVAGGRTTFEPPRQFPLVLQQKRPPVPMVPNPNRITASLDRTRPSINSSKAVAVVEGKSRKRSFVKKQSRLVPYLFEVVEGQGGGLLGLRTEEQAGVEEGEPLAEVITVVGNRAMLKVRKRRLVSRQGMLQGEVEEVAAVVVVAELEVVLLEEGVAQQRMA